MARAKPSAAFAANLYVSTSIAGDIAQRLGTAHYSYHFAAERFRDMLARAGVPPVHLPMPEYYGSPAALPARPAVPDLHLIFRSTEQIRLLKHATNICCFAWEFPVLKTDTLPGEHPFANQRAMLNLFDEIWTPSTYACSVLRAHGLGEVHRIPAPVPLPRGGRRSRTRAAATLQSLDAMTLNVNFTWPDGYQTEQTAATATTIGAFLAAHARGRTPPVVFLSVLNPGDFRKNLDPMLRGFHHLRTQHPGAVLIVKLLASRSQFSLSQAAGGVVRNKLPGGAVLRDDGIAFINAFLSDEEMSDLYSLADFYLCTSLAEGQNLPLLEAMAHGAVAVTTRNTAMDDYIDDSNAIVIATRDVPNDSVHLAGTIANRPFAVAACTARDVFAALTRALAESAKHRAARAAAGIATLRQHFSDDAVWPLVAQRLRHNAARAIS